MAKKEGLDDTKQSLLEHLTELRSRLIKSMLAIVATTTVALIFSPELLEYVMKPLSDVLQKRTNVETLLVHGDEARGAAIESTLRAHKIVNFQGRILELGKVRELVDEARKDKRFAIDLILVSSDLIMGDGAVLPDLLEGVQPAPEVVYLAKDMRDPAVAELRMLEGAQVFPDPPKSQVLDRIIGRARAAAGKATTDKLVMLSPIDPFFAYLKIALAIGLFLACPIWIYQVWKFVAPGLYKTEKMIVLPCVVSASLLFVIGGLFAYYAMFPVMFNVLVNQMMPSAVAGAFTVDRYLSLLLTMTVAFGVVFELPLAIAILAMIGLVTPALLKKFRRHAIVANFIFAAVITPTTDPLSLFMMAIPLCLFYEIGIILASVMYKRRARKLAEEDGAVPAPAA